MERAFGKIFPEWLRAKIMPKSCNASKIGMAAGLRGLQGIFAANSPSIRCSDSG
jgi:hypothetical protein